MLSQRIALYIIAQYFRVGEGVLEYQQIQNTKKEFRQNLKSLLQYNRNTDAIVPELVNLQASWERLEEKIEDLLEKDNTNSFNSVRDILQLSEQILLAFNEIVFLYKQLGEEYLNQLDGSK